MITKRFEYIQEGDSGLVGGKCLNLGLLTRAGFSVPEGFCVTTDAYRFVGHDVRAGDALEMPEDMANEILEAYDRLGGGRVAVRSSATAEDLPDASFAGQQDTFLNVQGGHDLLEAIKRCWASLWSDRAIAYRRQRGISDDKVLMAVAVQKMLDADCSGVMFSVSPVNEGQLMIEASWGLGEAIVSGVVTPDCFSVDRKSLRIVDRAISSKNIMITEQGETDVPEEKREVPCLEDEQIARLAHLALEIEGYYSSPQDVEWALVGDEFYVLQSRPITAHRPVLDQELEQLRQDEIRKLQEMAEDSGTVWCTFNLSETLPAPLPMTWAIISRFMSGRGGFGLTYRDLGFMPGREVDEKGVVDLICGRAYFNLSREARLYFADFPFEHNFEKLKRNPEKASYPQPAVNIKRSTASFWLKFPYYVYKMIAADRKMKRARKDYDNKLQTEIIPAYISYIEEQRKIKLDELSDNEIISKMDEWIDKTLRDFARNGLKASVLAGMSYSNLQAALTKCFGKENMLEGLIVGLQGDLTVEMNQKLWEVARGWISTQQFLDGYGHRAAGEFELAQPRWREDAAYVKSMVNMFRENEELNPEAQFLSQKEKREKTEEQLNEQLSDGKARAYRKRILTELHYAQRYLPYRETSKFYLMMGYELIRNALLELGQRHFDSADDIFYLIPDELPQLANCESDSDREVFHGKAAERKRKRSRLLSIDLPDVIFSDSLHEIGNPPLPEYSQELRGTPVSGGVATGKARVILKPPQSAENVGTSYILVCPSTDPGWAPLFPAARGLVMERGGVLSHGAIVAREYGIPAVVNVPGATGFIGDDQQIKVDGNEGKVVISDR